MQNPRTRIISANVKFIECQIERFGYSRAAFAKTSTSMSKNYEYMQRKQHCIDAARSFFQLIRDHHVDNNKYTKRLVAGDKTDSDAADALLLGVAVLQ